MIACRSPPPSIFTFAGIGYGPLVALVGVVERDANLRLAASETTVTGIPIGAPSQSPEPKSACMPVARADRSDDRRRVARDRQRVDALVPRVGRREDPALRRGDEVRRGGGRASEHEGGRQGGGGGLHSETAGYLARTSSTKAASRSASAASAELEHVLGVPLTGVGEVEAADEDRVVTDRQLRVHVVVDARRRVRRRALAGERRGSQHRLQRRRLPLPGPVSSGPLRRRPPRSA